MKKIIILFAGLAILIIKTQAQTYVPFPDSNVYWNEIDFYQGWCEPPNYCKYTLSIQGDTIINTQSYHKIYSDDSTSISYVGGLRENNKRIYYFERTCSHEILLYDFNLNIGDSIMLPCMLCDTAYPQYMKVVSIDSILLSDMSYRKKINFNWGSSMSWIEGIGSEFGLLYPYYTCILCVCWTELVCFEQNDTTIYSNETHVPCFDYIVSTNEIKNNSNLFQIYPNPAIDRVYIDCAERLISSTCKKDFKIQIYNVIGECVLQRELTNSTNEINVSLLSKGIYIIKLTSADWTVQRKLIKE